MSFKDKMDKFRDLVEKDSMEYYKKRHMHVPSLSDLRVIIIPGRKYWKVDISGSGRFMVEVDTEVIYGIKSYGQVHKGKRYGNLDSISEWYWGEYYPIKGREKRKDVFRKSIDVRGLDDLDLSDIKFYKGVR
jgi:hypothetical protein